MANDKIHVFINRTKYDLASATHTGRALKELAGIAQGDVLFLQQPGDDVVVANDSTITLKNGDHLHSQPPADYGDGQRHGAVTDLAQPNGGRFLIYSDFQIPPEYRPSSVRLLVKLPPTFPDAQPDMFWISPSVVVAATGASPMGTSVEELLGQPWQRFSWHLAAGAWRPGVSELRDYLRCIIGRFERRN